MTAIPASSLPAKYQGQVAAQIDGKLRAPAPRIRQQQGDGMNNWEREWLMLLRARPGHQFDYREISFPLANNLRYKLDFLTVRDPRTIEGFEVKGFARSTGIAKLKMAARLYPFITFYLVYKRKGAWETELVRS